MRPNVGGERRLEEREARRKSSDATDGLDGGSMDYEKDYKAKKNADGEEKELWS